MKKPILSVVVCTYNRSALLRSCISTLIKQKVNPAFFEIVVIDNNSSDNTHLLVQDFQKKTKNLFYFKEPKLGLSFSRNRGCIKANGEYVLYVDDDVKTPQNYVNNILKVIKKYSPDIAGGPIYPYYTSSKPFWFKDKYEIRSYAKSSGFSVTCSVSGGNFLIKKRLLKKLGLFDIRMGMKGTKLQTGEERKVLETYRKLTPIQSQKVFYSLECFVYHHVPYFKMNLFYMMMRSYEGGRSLSKINKDLHKHGENDSKIHIYTESRLKKIMYILNEFFKDLQHSEVDFVEILKIVCFRIGYSFGRSD